MNITIKKQTSHFRWEVSTLISNPIVGIFKIKNSNIIMNDGKIISGEIILDMNSIDIENINNKLESSLIKKLKKENFFDVSKYPTASFKIKDVSSNYLIGDLRIKNITHSLRINFEKTNNTYIGDFEIERDSFNLIYGDHSLLGNIEDHFISEKVKIAFKLDLDI